MKKTGISFIGAGKVAGAFCSELFNSGHRIINIVAETEDSCRRLAESCNASWSLDTEFKEDTDLILIAVPDDKIESVAAGIKCNEKTVVAHMAGSVGLDVFHQKYRHVGVIYPLQTFSAGRNIEFSKIPFFIEGSDKDTITLLCGLVESLGAKAYFADAEGRRLLHLSAVFVNNFVNHMLVSGKAIASMAGFQFEVLVPLLNETILKAVTNGPENSQTGPAVRSDQGTIKSHIKLLSFSPDLQNIYREVTGSIMRFQKKNINE
ncbi:MAG TPA: DUF2520 domain-containing protein [Bacteroidales bacterium]|nr:DUF2520 domain-containing protein [Bacteroidales bacterium]HNR43296.1 DUF2520 domain-containing protein [Bacteroidales bacterium]HPM18897.1 DUF2520 domain-containing protein [Bacteroidales bacterium]HQG78293.1 DUF2520 domain-containing protein [Bacteroidales bacterium]